METALVQLDALRTRLAQIEEPSEAVGIRDVAEALRIYAKIRGESIATQNEFAEIKLRAERRTGEILAGMKLQAGARGVGKKVESHDVTPLLSDYGISKMQSSRWRREANVPDETFIPWVAKTKAAGRVLTSLGLLRLAKKLEKEARRETKLKVPENLPGLADRLQLFCHDVKDLVRVINVASVDVIITDPPYRKEDTWTYEALAELGAHALKEGGSLLAMAGQSYLPEVLSLMERHLSYHWTVAYMTPGGQAAQLWQRKVNTFWKPVLWFVKGDYGGDWIGDVAESPVNENDKRFSDWGQSENGIAELIAKFSYPGDVILDPFCGGGTTGLVALRMNRAFIGADKDAESIKITKQRIFTELVGDGS